MVCPQSRWGESGENREKLDEIEHNALSFWDYQVDIGEMVQFWRWKLAEATKLKNEIEIWTRSIYNCDYKNGDDIDKNSEIKSRILDET